MFELVNSSTIKVEGKSSSEQHERAKSYLSKHAILRFRS